MAFKKYQISTDALASHEIHLEALKLTFSACNFTVIPNQYTDINGNKFIFCHETDDEFKFYTEIFPSGSDKVKPLYQQRSNKFKAYKVITFTFEFNNKSYELIGELGRALLVYSFQDEAVYTCSFSDLIKLDVLSNG